MQMKINKNNLGWQYLDKINFKTNTIIRDKEGHYIILKRSIQQEDITLINIYTLNIGSCKYV